MSESFNTRTISTSYTMTTLPDAVRIDLESSDGESAWVVFTGTDARDLWSDLLRHSDEIPIVCTSFLVASGYWSKTPSYKGVRVELAQVSYDLLVLRLRSIAFVLNLQEVKALMEALEGIVVTEK